MLPRVYVCGYVYMLPANWVLEEGGSTSEYVKQATYARLRTQRVLNLHNLLTEVKSHAKSIRPQL